MAMTVPGQQRSNFRPTWGQSDRFQKAIQARLQLQQNVDKLQADQRYRDESLKLQEKRLDEDSAYRKQTTQFAQEEKTAAREHREKMIEFAQAEKTARQEHRANVLAHQKTLQTEAINANIRNDNFRKSKLGIESINTYGANIFNVDKEGNITLPPAVVKDKSGKYVRNPELPPQVQVDIKDKRYVTLQELSNQLKVNQAIKEFTGLNTVKSVIEKKKVADAYVFDPFKFRVTEEKGGFWFGGFSEKDALNELMKKSQHWNEITNIVSVLEKDNPKRLAVLAALKELAYGKGGSKDDIKLTGLAAIPTDKQLQRKDLRADVRLLYGMALGQQYKYFPTWGPNRDEYRLKQKTLSNILKARIAQLEK